MSKGIYWRHYWSHTSRIHVFTVKLAYKILRQIPHAIKYGIGKKLRKAKLPYSMIKPGDFVVQVGAPADILHAGRSRALYFSIFAGNSGRMLAVEPDKRNAEAFRNYASEHGLENVAVAAVGLWESKGNLAFYVNDRHPASNFIAGIAEEEKRNMQDFRRVEVPVDTLDNLLQEYGFGIPALVSITTNGSEMSILKGMTRTIASGLRYISLARTGSGYEEMMAELGYGLIGYDDRGYTFERIDG